MESSLVANANPIGVRRTDPILRPDQSRVLLRPFKPGDAQRVANIIARVMSIPEEWVGALLGGIFTEFAGRHQQIRSLFLERFDEVCGGHVAEEDLSEERRMLIGSYFFAEYSLESAALFNPSIVRHPDQADGDHGLLRR